MLALLGLAAAALVPLPIRPAAHLSQTRHVHVRRAGRLCSEATAPPEPAATEPEADDATERDEAITRFTNEQGVNLLIGRESCKSNPGAGSSLHCARSLVAQAKSRSPRTGSRRAWSTPNTKRPSLEAPT